MPIPDQAIPVKIKAGVLHTSIEAFTAFSASVTKVQPRFTKEHACICLRPVLESASINLTLSTVEIDRVLFETSRGPSSWISTVLGKSDIFPILLLTTKRVGRR